MNREKFQQLLDLHGADLGRWPQAERTAAETVLADDPEMQSLFETTRRADKTVRVASRVPSSGALAAQIVASASRDGERPAFVVTPVRTVLALAGSVGIAGAGYAAAASLAAFVIPGAALDALSVFAAGGFPGAF
jgi:anti-sigma factor RsiW